MYQRILVIVTDHPSSQVAIRHALCLARGLAAELLLVHPLVQLPVTVVDMPPVVTISPDDFAPQSAERGRQLLADARALADERQVRARTQLLDAADVVDGITSLAREQACDLIVVGAERGNALVRLLTGSPVPGLITRATVPVMVCHADDRPQPP